MPTRTFAVAAALVGATALATTGLTYASAAGPDRPAPAAKPAAKPAVAHVHRAAPPARHPAAPAAPAPQGKTDEKRDEGRDGGHEHGGGHGHRHEGRIHFNERTYSAAEEGCIVAASGLGSSSFSVFNDSDKTVEVFRGFTCDNGAPVAVVGPHGDTFGVVTRTAHEGYGEQEDHEGFGGFGGYGGSGGFGGLFPDDGVVGSFRVIGHHDDEW
ncbi:hypothetical protein ACWEWI_33150 [Streptomyces sp. NPDC003753]|uniref:hypothetical protein n=1 Tax=unclassified Streptomyces TaxID=2593676 RepID=UPI0019063FE2|nr:hypothetical protein [Streptomyces sp. Y2F8-2]GHK05756.1 hypothetical protein SY2F82_75530 [Streptomyces sp. Y2F8-2]